MTRSAAESIPCSLRPTASHRSPLTAAVTELDGADSWLFPTALVARTSNVYAVFGISPLTSTLVVVPFAVVVLKVVGTPLSSAVAVYDVIGLPPLDTGAVQFTVACPLPATALTPVGAPGTFATISTKYGFGLSSNVVLDFPTFSTQNVTVCVPVLLLLKLKLLDGPYACTGALPQFTLDPLPVPSHHW